uniref:RHD domain-containing protein n=1 Tax=Clastoptera arizonana TaxID=38151 RepID=A0A1B6CGI4_9HEMI
MDSESSAVNISDVIAVIETDPVFGKTMMGLNKSPTGPYIEIIEQPAPKALRFRYECEGRSAGSIPGVNSSPENKTFPTIQIVGYKGRAVVVVSCVTKDSPHRPHPHNLVGREGCRKGVCTLEVNSETMNLSFANLGIQCVKKKDIEDALRIREEIRVDPFKTGFQHKTQPGSIDLNAVRLCFQAFIEGSEPGKFTIPLYPVVSDTIYDKKAMSDLVICKLSDCSSSVVGGKEIILLCEKVAKEDISVRLFEKKNGEIVWEGYGDFTPTQVHKQVAIAFKTPRYKSIEVENAVQVFIQLKRPSDGAESDPLPFTLTSLESGRPGFWSLRRGKGDYRTFTSILQADTKLLTRVGQPKETAVITLESVEEDKQNSATKGINQDNNNNHQQRCQTPELPKISDAYSILKKNKQTSSMEIQGNKTTTSEILPIVDLNSQQFMDLPPLDSIPPELHSSDQKINENINMNDDMEQGFNELMTHVNELDDMINSNADPDFGIYTSLQLAMKNPCEFIDFSQMSGYEDVLPPRPTASKPAIITPEQQLKVDKAEEILPPLPPKRAKKTPGPVKNLPPVPEGKKIINISKTFFIKTER